MSHTSFLGIPVDGEITKGDMRAAQLPLSDLEPLIWALLNDPTIVEFGWEQYTPYFNDGEPCIFGAGQLWVRTTTDAASKNDDEDGGDEAPESKLSVEYDHPSLGQFSWEYFGDAWPRERRVVLYEGPDQARLERCLALNTAIEGGAFDDVLIEAFGDHAKVTVRRDGISVSFVDHD